MKENRPIVAITMGDPAGIGPEITAKALVDPRVRGCCRPMVYGNMDRMMRGASTSRTAIAFVAGLPETAWEKANAKTIRLHDPAGVDFPDLAWGAPTRASATAMVAYLKAAIDDALVGRIAAIATGPINKEAMKLAGVPFDGHTEILAHRTQTTDYAMMLAGDRLRVVLATIHIPLQRVPRRLTSEGITKTIELTHGALKDRFGIPVPRIAVAGLNPHAGEAGLFGNEEAQIIAPAIAMAATQGMRVTGPHPPDTVFFAAAQGAYDAVVAMYHDQGLGPFKMIHFEDGVNTTLGLPVIRTSVDHGTAYDIAGDGSASAESMVAAILMAAHQARCCMDSPQSPSK